MGLITGIAKRAARRSIFFLIAKAVGLVFASLFGWIGDLYWLVKAPALESPFERMAQSFSYCVWQVLPLALIYISTALTSLPFGLGEGGIDYRIILATILFSAFVATIHRLAAVNVGLPPRRFVKVWTTTMNTPLHWAVLLIAGLAAPVLIAMMELPGQTVSLYVAYFAWLVVSHTVSLAASRHHVEDRRLTARHGASLATVFKVTPQQFDDAAELHTERGTGALIISPAPPAATSKREDVEDALATTMPDWEMDEKRSNHSRLVLVPVSLATGDRRAALADSAGLLTATVNAENTEQKTKTVKLPAGIDLSTVEGHAKFHALVAKKVGSGWAIQEIVDGKAVLVRGVASARPSAAVWKLAADMGEKEAAVKAAGRCEAKGLSLVSFDFDRRTATVANTLPVVRALRSRLAEALRCLTHEVELNIAWAGQGPALVTVLRAPRPNVDSFKRREFWLAEIPAIIGTPRGHLWTYTEDAATGTVQMGCAIDPLGKIVEYNADPSIPVLPTDPWQVGVDEAGDVVEIDLAGSAHMLIAGATRSGKSVGTYGLLVHVLRMGDRARLLVADPNDTTIAPFEHLVSWGTSSTEPAPVTTMLQWVRKEMDRRKPLLRKMRADKVSEFTPELPLIVVVIDEAANYMRHSKTEEAKAMTTELLAVASQGAKYGVRVVLITQRPDSTILPTAIRSQLSARMSFRLEDLESAKMTFPDIEDPADLLNFAPGVGLIKEVAGKPRRFRSAYLDDHWGAADQIKRPMTKIDVHSDPTAYSVTDLDEMELDMGDLDIDLGELEMELELPDTLSPAPVSLLKEPTFPFPTDPNPFSEASTEAGSVMTAVKARLVIEDEGLFDDGAVAEAVKKPKLVLGVLKEDDPFA